MQFTNISNMGELEVPELHKFVGPGETIEVTPEQAAGLAGQVSVWEAADDEAQAVHDAAIAALQPEPAPEPEPVEDAAPADPAPEPEPVEDAAPADPAPEPEPVEDAAPADPAAAPVTKTPKKSSAKSEGQQN